MPNVSEWMAAIDVIAASASFNVKPLDKLTVFCEKNEMAIIKMFYDFVMRSMQFDEINTDSP